MDMTLAGFIALGALITGLFAWLRQDIRELRKDMDSKFSSLRNELDSKIGSLRNDLDSKIGLLRNELDSKIGSLDSKIGELSERVARIEGLLEAVFMRRDLTPFPEPPPSGDRPDKPRAA